jgi:hypothetical protein
LSNPWARVEQPLGQPVDPAPNLTPSETPPPAVAVGLGDQQPLRMGRSVGAEVVHDRHRVRGEGIERSQQNPAVASLLTNDAR